MLIVEDHDGFAGALRALLETDPWVEVVGQGRNGQEGLSLATQLHPDVVLMDIELPVMDGVAATREICARHPQLPVVAVSGSEYEERVREIMDAGAVEFVPKGRLDRDLRETVISIATRRDSES